MVQGLEGPSELSALDAEPVGSPEVQLHWGEWAGEGKRTSVRMSGEALEVIPVWNADGQTRWVALEKKRENLMFWRWDRNLMGIADGMDVGVGDKGGVKDNHRGSGQSNSVDGGAIF